MLIDTKQLQVEQFLTKSILVYSPKSERVLSDTEDKWVFTDFLAAPWDLVHFKNLIASKLDDLHMDYKLITKYNPYSLTLIIKG